METVGFAWIWETLLGAVRLPPLRHRSFIGSAKSVRETPADKIVTYPAVYRPEATPLAHLVFTLKYEPIRLDVMRAAFLRIPAGEIEAFVAASPGSAYARRLAFFAEWLTGTELTPPPGIAGAYVEALDPAELVVAANPFNVTKWRVRDNLPGTRDFCPLVRKTPIVGALLSTPWSEQVQAALNAIPPELLKRAVNHLYGRETKSTWDIEGEELPKDRGTRFMLALSGAGTGSEPLSEQNLVALQNVIVDPRYAATAFRTNQNYVGQTTVRAEIIHYICPPPTQVAALMRGLEAVARIEMPAAVKAAIVSFGFVFVHPFEDGNGRIHRYLARSADPRRNLTTRHDPSGFCGHSETARALQQSLGTILGTAGRRSAVRC